MTLSYPALHQPPSEQVKVLLLGHITDEAIEGGHVVLVKPCDNKNIDEIIASRLAQKTEGESDSNTEKKQLDPIQEIVQPTTNYLHVQSSFTVEA
jgi:dihydroxyacid dehydratase/phosphogluconate dehydratase